MTTDPQTLTRQAHERIREALGLGAGDTLDEARLDDGLSLALKALIGIDQVTTGAWGQMAPGSADRTESGIAALAGAYLRSGSDADREAPRADPDPARLPPVRLPPATPPAGPASRRPAARPAPARPAGRPQAGPQADATPHASPPL